MTATRGAVGPLILLVGSLVVVQASTARSVQQGAADRTEAFTAFAVNLGNVGGTRPTPVDITITRWTTAGERELLMSVIREKSADKVRDAMLKMPSVGTIRTPDSLAYQFRYSSQELTRDGLRRIILMTDRPIDAREASTRPYTIDYPFMTVDLRLDSTGRGKGTLSIATKLTLLDNLLIVEGLADRPVDLNDVKRVTRR